MPGPATSFGHNFVFEDCVISLTLGSFVHFRDLVAAGIVTSLVGGVGTCTTGSTTVYQIGFSLCYVGSSAVHPTCGVGVSIQGSATVSIMV